ncbi:hypothetical protein A8950_2581 [Dongia mobilis]|uniref:Uncharacterized protein n=1 Tax=Dongia mobilis TaxID=578943 RepID=A0A4R6WLC7_9PROT|nr:hypothetical protein [Dongia mobilis]TDQ81512.1 hypothetical protein A8950_2581 [Dongia mobilis]
MALCHWSLLFGLLSIGQLTAIAAPAQAEENALADALLRHFSDVVVTLPSPENDAVGAPSYYLRWSKTNLQAVYLSPTDDPDILMAESAGGLLRGAIEDTIEIKTIQIKSHQIAEGNHVDDADIVFLLSANTAAHAHALSSQVAKLRTADLTWIEGADAFGPGCGATVGYDPTIGRIVKAVLTIDKEQVFAPFGTSGNRLNHHGLMFRCVNRQLMAALGLMKDWGKSRSADKDSVFGPRTDRPPFNDMHALALLYLPSFASPQPTETAEEIISANALCLIENGRVCSVD